MNQCFSTVMLGERVVLLMSGVERARCSSVSHGSTQEQYTEMDISTTALQFIDFLKKGSQMMKA